MVKSLLEEKKSWTKSKVLDAAKTVFLKKGYANTTIEEVAKTAGVSKGSIYLYFKNKDDLYLSLMIPVLADINHSLKELLRKVSDKKCQNYKDFVKCFYEHYKHIYKHDAEGIRVIQAFQMGDYISQLSETNRELLNKYTKNNFQIARDIFSIAMDLNLISKANPIILSDWFWSTFIGVVQFEESKLRETKKDHVLTTMEEIFLIISNALAPYGELKMQQKPKSA